MVGAAKDVAGNAKDVEDVVFRDNEAEDVVGRAAHGAVEIVAEHDEVGTVAEHDEVEIVAEHDEVELVAAMTPQKLFWFHNHYLYWTFHFNFQPNTAV